MQFICVTLLRRTKSRVAARSGRFSRTRIRILKWIRFYIRVKFKSGSVPLNFRTIEIIEKKNINGLFDRKPGYFPSMDPNPVHSHRSDLDPGRLNPDP